MGFSFDLVIQLILHLKTGKILKIAFRCILFIPLLFFFSNYLVQYYFVYPKNKASKNYYQYGVYESTKYIAEVEDNYDTIYFTSKANQPFVYLLFATCYDPVLFARDPEKIIDYTYFGRVYRFGKYIFFTTGRNAPFRIPCALCDTCGQ